MNPIPEPTVVKSPDKDEKILDAATRVFAQYGFHQADTQTIADLAQVGKGTVIRYFTPDGFCSRIMSLQRMRSRRCPSHPLLE